jgi:hypothetical protein
LLCTTIGSLLPIVENLVCLPQPLIAVRPLLIVPALVHTACVRTLSDVRAPPQLDLFPSSFGMVAGYQNV